uniref:DUF155 domain-containing protein n=1 Tax=Dunaliella tertiolecta TaxID=3047 RepID=A0A7S3QPF7_DUNTE
MKKGDSPLQVPLLPTTQPRSRSSPAPSHGRTQATRRQQATIAPGQPLPTGRQKDKFVPLPEEADAEEQAAQAAAAEVLAPHPTQVPLEWHERPAIFEDLPQLGVLPPPLPDSSKRGRATLYCIAESFDRKKLEELLKLTYPAEQVLSYPDVFYVEYIKGSGDQPGGDVFFFDYGVVACWGLTKSQEMTIVRGMARQCNVQGLSDSEIETDEYEYNFTTTEKPHVQNDTVTLHKRFAQESQCFTWTTTTLAES